MTILLGQLKQEKRRLIEPSACADRRTENVAVLAVVKTKLELGNVERQVFLRHVMEGPNKPALNQRPERLDRIGMNRTDDILPALMVNERMREVLTQLPIASVCIGAEQAYLFGNCRTDEVTQGFTGYAIENSRDDISVTSNGAHHYSFTTAPGTASRASSTGAAALVLMPVLSFAADVGFIDSDVPRAKSVGIYSRI